jgi:hypothetical protein
LGSEGRQVGDCISACTSIYVSPPEIKAAAGKCGEIYPQDACPRRQRFALSAMLVVYSLELIPFRIIKCLFVFLTGVNLDGVDAQLRFPRCFPPLVVAGVILLFGGCFLLFSKTS